MALTLWSKRADMSAEQLTRVAHGLETELKRVPGTRQIHTLGSHDEEVLVTVDPRKLNAFGIDWDHLRQSLSASNAQHQPLDLTQNNQQIRVQVGDFIGSARELADLVIATHDGKPVYLADVATLSEGAISPRPMSG